MQLIITNTGDKKEMLCCASLNTRAWGWMQFTPSHIRV